MSRGRFITLEGGEGAGKSSSLAFVENLLNHAGKQVLVTREPGGTALGEELRGLLLDHRHDGMSPDAELLMMFAARAEHLHRVILPALSEGQWVLCDRFTDATYAYQGGGRRIPRERIATLETWVQGDLRPDLTLLLDVPVDVGLQRASGRSAADRFEKESLRFFNDVRAAYLGIATTHPERVKIIDASRSPEEVKRQLEAVVRGFMDSDG